MKEMTCKIRIKSGGQWRTTPFVMAVAVKSSWREITDTASVELPDINWIKGNGVAEGDQIEIYTGHNDDLIKEFTGYISSIRSRLSSAFLLCEDESYQLKRQKVAAKTFDNGAKLSEVLEYVAPGVEFAGNDVTLDGLRIEENTVYGVLSHLKEPYGLTIYFNEQTLFAGLAYNDKWRQLDEPVVFDFQRNIDADRVQLEFMSEDEIRVQFKGISITESGKKTKKIEYTAGDPDGGMHTLHYYGKTEAELKALVDEQLRLTKFSGLRGSFHTFGRPVAVHGNTMELRCNRREQYNGRYFIDATQLTYNENSGLRRLITPGRTA